jgi:8-oxo-dGTP pyrophosphatase MutT (NUDIX family)
MQSIDLNELLHKYEPGNDVEKRFKKRMVQFLDSTRNPFERSNFVGHFTASCLLLNRNEDQALLMLHSKLNRWFQLGGHCDGNPNILNVAIKEAEEESGLLNVVPVISEIFDIDIHLIPGSKDVPEHFHFDVRFLLKTTNDQSVKKNHEAKELRWVEKRIDTDIPTENESVCRLISKWKNL